MCRSWGIIVDHAPFAQKANSNNWLLAMALAALKSRGTAEHFERFSIGDRRNAQSCTACRRSAMEDKQSIAASSITGSRSLLGQSDAATIYPFEVFYVSHCPRYVLGALVGSRDMPGWSVYLCPVRRTAAHSFTVYQTRTDTHRAHVKDSSTYNCTNAILSTPIKPPYSHISSCGRTSTRALVSTKRPSTYPSALSRMLGHRDSPHVRYPRSTASSGTQRCQ